MFSHKSSIARFAAPLAIAASMGWALPAHAQDDGDAAALKAELAQMRDAMAQMANRVDQLEGQLAEADA